MSYCRWSSDDFKSDIYCYESCDGGFEIMVAENKILGDIPHVPFILDVSTEEYMLAYDKQSKFLKTAKHENLNLKHDGERFNEPTAKEAADRLEYLRDIGYNVPEHAIKSLREEDE